MEKLNLYNLGNIMQGKENNCGEKCNGLYSKRFSYVMLPVCCINTAALKLNVQLS